MEDKKNSCIFWRVITHELASSRVYEDEDCLAFMDIFPLRAGHVLVMPKHHHQHLEELPATLRARLWELANQIGGAMRQSSTPPDGIHYIVNDGRAAFQTVPHLHIHVLPRRRGDALGLLGQVLKRPLLPLLKPVARTKLDRQARELSSRLIG